MKTTLLLLASLAVSAGLASASVTYSTAAVFNCTDGTLTGTQTIAGCGTSAITIDDVASSEAITLTFDNLSNENVNATNLTGAQYGFMQATCVGAGCVDGGASISVPVDDLSITLTITESTPDVGGSANDVGTASISGGISFNSTSLQIGAYSLSPLVISGTDVVTYTTEPSNLLTPPGNGLPPGGDTLSMEITDANAIQSSAPEPMSMALMGLGLGAIGLMWRRKRS
jgi:hypothetical protein